MSLLKTIKLFFTASFLLAIFFPQNSYAKDGFMTLPFKSEPSLMQGWIYNFGSRTHQGIDYYAKVGTEILAVGEGTARPGYQPGRNFVYGKYMVLNHKNGYKSLYAHLSQIKCLATCNQGSVIAISGMTGTDNEHLHFEVLSSTKYGNGLNRGYGWRVDSYDLYTTSSHYPPNKGFTRLGTNHLWQGEYPKLFTPPPTPQKLSLISSGEGGAELSWDECTESGFQKYELYRSESEAEKGEIIHSATDSKMTTFKDSGLYASQNYFYLLVTYYKDGRKAESNTVTINIPRETTNISNKAGVQRFVGASKGKIYWEDTVREKTTFPEKRTFYYYDLTEKVVKTIIIGDSLDNQIQGPYKPQIAGDWLCYHGKKSWYGNNEVYCRNLTAGNMSADIQISLGGGENLDPQISEEGVLVWKGGTNGRLFSTNLNQGTEVRELTETTVIAPRIWGKNVVYQEKETNTTFKLWVMNIETGEKRLLKSGIDVSYSDIWENQVVFTRGDKVYLINLANPTEETLIAETDHNNARIRDGKVVYSKFNRDGTSTIFVYIISARKTLAVTDPLKYVPLPVIFGNFVAYDGAAADSSIDMDVFLTCI